MSVSISSNYTQRFYTWTEFKTVLVSKNLICQCDDNGIFYTVYGYDGPEVHLCNIYKGAIPYSVENSYSQVQNDLDKNDFETNHMASCNQPINPYVIVGSTDNTSIGNVGDRLKVQLDTSSIPIKTNFDDRNTDAFGRLRTSNPESLIDYTFEYDKQPLIFSELAASGGTATHDNNKKSIVLSCTATNGSSIKFRTKRYLKYHPGKSQLILMTGCFNGTQTGTTKRIGQYDEDNGFYFELNGSTLSVNIRSKVTGSIVNTSIAQSNWNLDKLDGTGLSGATIDVTKQQIFIIDYQWIGSGRIRYGFCINGINVYCHQIVNANILAYPYSQTATLPISAEITGTGTAGSFWITCGTVMSEGNYAIEGIIRSVSNNLTPRSFGLIGQYQIPLIAIRTQSDFSKVPVKIEDFGVFAGSADDFLVSIVMNPTISGGSWSSVDGVCEINVSGTNISGGVALYNCYLRGSSSSLSISTSDALLHANNFILGLALDGTRDILAVVATNLTSTASAYGFINYRELL